MAMLVHLKNLSSSAEKEDVRSFFEQADVDIPDGGINIVKSKDGSAFINFSSSQDLLVAVKLDGQELLGQPVKLLLITVEEKDQILTEMRKDQLLAATKGESKSSEGRKDRAMQGVTDQTGSGAFEDYLCVSGLPKGARRINLINFLGANPACLARNAIAIRPKENDDEHVVAFVKYINQQSFKKGLTKDGGTYAGEKVVVRQSDIEEFEMEMKQSGQGDVDSRKRALDDETDDLDSKKSKTDDDKDVEAHYIIVKNLNEYVRPSALKELFGWIEYDRIVMRPDKKDRSMCVAFMKFTDAKAYEKAIAQDREYFQGQQIFVRAYSEPGFESERRQHGTHADRLAMSELCVFITNIDGSVSERDLRKLFGRRIWDSIPDDGILMRPDLKFPEKQVAYVMFRTKAAYETVLNTDNRQLNGKWMVMKKSSEKQFMIQKRFIEEERQQMRGFQQNMPNFNQPMAGGGGNMDYRGMGNMGFANNAMGQGYNGGAGNPRFGQGMGFGNAGGPSMGANNMGQGMFQSQNRCYLLVNNLPSHADLKWVHQLFDDCPLKVSQSCLVSEGMLPLYAYVELQNEMDCARACSRDGRRIDNVVLSIRKTNPEAVQRDLNTLPPRMRVIKMDMDEFFVPKQKIQDPFADPSRGRDTAGKFGFNQQDQIKNFGYQGGYGQGQVDEWNDHSMNDPHGTPNNVLSAIRELEAACGSDVEVIEMKALPKKLNHEAVFAWLKQQPGNLEVVGKNSDVVNIGNSQVEVILIAVKNFTTALPKWAFIDKVICEIKHKSQRNACPGCRRLDHRNVDDGCPAAAETPDVIYFDAADHPFSPLHFSMMPFHFKNKNFVSILHAYLWEECHHLGFHDLRNAIMHVQDPRMSNLKEFIFGIPKLEALNWEMRTFDTLASLYKAKWEVCPEFRQALYETGTKTLVFANSRCTLGVGIQPSSLVRKLSPLYYQGENIIGKVIMNIRDEKNHLYRE